VIKVVIKNNGMTGWVEMPLTSKTLKSIRPEQFLNKQEMIKFALHDLELNYKRAYSYLKNCAESIIYNEKLDPNLKFITRWIDDSFGLLLTQNPYDDSKSIMRHMWYKIHSKSVPEKSSTNIKNWEFV